MKNYFLVTGLFISLLSCSGTQSKNNEPTVETSNQTNDVINKVVNKSEYKELMKKEGAQLIDVRTPEEYNGGHIDDATNIDFYEADFKEKMSKLDKNKPVLLYCRSGSRSGKAAQMLEEMGYTEIYNLEGGYMNW